MAQFTNQAQLSYGGRLVRSNVVIGNLQEVLQATKTAVTETYAQGDKVTYVVSLVNSGANEITGLTISDDLGAYAFGEQTLVPLDYADGSIRYFQNGVLQAAPTVTGTSPLVITGISVPAGGDAMLIYEATVNEFAPVGVGGEVTNTATVTGNLATPLSASETITSAAAPVLTISKSAEPLSVVENDTLTYAFLIQNYGNTAADASENVSVSDTFNPILTDLTVTLDGTPLAADTGYSYDETTGVFSTADGVITVPAATASQDPTTGAWSAVPGTATLIVSGTV